MIRESGTQIQTMLIRITQAIRNTARNGGMEVTGKTRMELPGGNQTLYAHWTTAPVTVIRIESGSWMLHIPSYYGIVAYQNPTDLYSHSGTGGGPVVFEAHCTRRAELSNGEIRYYGDFGDGMYWLAYSCEMDFDPD